MASLYEMAQGPAFDPVESFYAGRNARQMDKFNQNKLAEIARADQARPLMGKALMGDAGSLNALAGLDPNAFMDVANMQSKQAAAQRELSDAEKQQIAGALYAADTPEKWAATINWLKQQGHDVEPEAMDFANRDALMGAALGPGGMQKADQFNRGFGLQQFNAETSRMNAMKPAGGAGFSLSPGQTRYDANGNQLAASAPKVQPRALTSVDKSAILEADDQVQTGKNTIDMLKSALALNDTAGSGYFSGAQAFAARNDPTGFFDAKKGAATTDFNNIVMGQALSGMKAIFGGNPTEGERSVLMQLQGMADKTPVERKSIIDRAIKMAQRRVDFNTERAAQLRSGDYFGGASTVDPQAYPGADGITNQDMGGGFNAGGADIPSAAVEELTADPSPAARAEFDAIFGEGASAQILGQ